jgi:hypothetical protein
MSEHKIVCAQTQTENEHACLPEKTLVSLVENSPRCASAAKLQSAYEGALLLSEKYRFPPVVNGYPSIQISSQERRKLGSARRRTLNELYAHTVSCPQCLLVRGTTGLSDPYA